MRRPGARLAAFGGAAAGDDFRCVKRAGAHTAPFGRAATGDNWSPGSDAVRVARERTREGASRSAAAKASGRVAVPARTPRRAQRQIERRKDRDDSRPRHAVAWPPRTKTRVGTPGGNGLAARQWRESEKSACPAATYAPPSSCAPPGPRRDWPASSRRRSIRGPFRHRNRFPVWFGLRRVRISLCLLAANREALTR